MKMKVVLLSSFFLFSFLVFGQEKGRDKVLKNRNSIEDFLKENPLEVEEKVLDYYRSYDYYADLFEVRNEMVFTVDFFIWQDDNGKRNYKKSARNDSVFRYSIDYVNRFYSENATPSFRPLPDVKDYSTTKIKFKLGNIYYERDSECLKKGRTANYKDGVFLNEKADSLQPKSKGNLKIHVTAVDPKHKGYATIPRADMSHQHFVVTYNKEEEENVGDNGDPSIVAWAFAHHLAHEFGHNFDLHHTYSGGYCNEGDPDYLDDVFGSSKNNSKVCPQQGYWGCDFTSPDNTCTNNIMGGTSSGVYFSPKQIQRMHRALTLSSIRNYAVAYQFNKRKFITISKNEEWTNNMKIYNSIKIENGATLTVKNTLEFVPEAEIVIMPGGKLILDGGLLTNEAFLKKEWKGIKVGKKKNKKEVVRGELVVINDGKIENAKRF